MSNDVDKMVKGRGQSELIALIIMTGILLVIAIVTLYFGGDLLNRSSGIGEFVSAQSSLVSLANMLSKRASIEGAAGSVVIPTKMGDVAVTATGIRIYFRGSTLIPASLLAYNGSRLNAVVYYAHPQAAGRLVTGMTLEPGDYYILYGNSGYNSTRYPIFVNVYYDFTAGRWAVALNATRVLYSQLLENKTIVYLVFIEYPQDPNLRVSFSDSSTLRFYVREVVKEVLPLGERLEIYFNSVKAGSWGGPGLQVTVIISKVRISVEPVGGG